MALKIGFTFKTLPHLSQARERLSAIASVASSRIIGEEYGSGVKAVCIGIVLMEAEHVERFVKRPFYRSGRYVLKQGGFPLAFEDTLEFDLAPPVEEVRRATTNHELAVSLRRALSACSSSLRKMTIPDFDMVKFLADLDTVLGDLSNSEGAKVYGGLTRMPGLLDDVDASNTPIRPLPTGQPSVKDFAREVLDFVEREMPNVQLAVQKQRADLLMPIPARADQFVQRWRINSPAALEACPACAYLIVDVVREGAIELGGTRSEERERLHKEFQKPLQDCKAFARSNGPDNRKAS